MTIELRHRDAKVEAALSWDKKKLHVRIKPCGRDEILLIEFEGDEVSALLEFLNELEVEAAWVQP